MKTLKSEGEILGMEFEVETKNPAASRRESKPVGPRCHAQGELPKQPAFPGLRRTNDRGDLARSQEALD